MLYIDKIMLQNAGRRGGFAPPPRIIERSAIFLNRTYIFILYIMVNWRVQQTGAALICTRRPNALNVRSGGEKSHCPEDM